MARAEALEDKAVTRSYVRRRLVASNSLMVVVSAVAYQLIPASWLSVAPLDTVASRIVLTLQWNALTVTVFLSMVLFIGCIRNTTNQQNPLVTADFDKVEVGLLVLFIV